jgi:hypothetical protein
MKYLKDYSQQIFSVPASLYHYGDWVVPAFSTLKFDAYRPYQIITTIYNGMHVHTPYKYKLENIDHEDPFTEFYESQLRLATKKEIETEVLRRAANLYNL